MKECKSVVLRDNYGVNYINVPVDINLPKMFNKYRVWSFGGGQHVSFVNWLMDETDNVSNATVGKEVEIYDVYRYYLLTVESRTICAHSMSVVRERIK
jgi:hypothetical protein